MATENAKNTEKEMKMRDKFAKWLTVIVLIVLALFAFSPLAGCTHQAAEMKRAVTRLNVNQEAREEHSRALTTGIVDALSFAPTNAPTALARQFAQKDQLLEGMPLERIDVPGILAGEAQATEELQQRYGEIDRLNQEKSDLEAKLKATQERLVEMGKKYEEEHNQTLVKRIWHWALGSLGLTGTIAAIVAICVFCPAMIPIFGRILAWLVGRFPKLIEAVGVVGKDTFYAVGQAVGKFRQDHQGTALDEHLREQTAGHERVIDHMREKLGV